jgi:hypothetical protein
MKQMAYKLYNSATLTIDSSLKRIRDDHACQCGETDEVSSSNLSNLFGYDATIVSWQQGLSVVFSPF